MFKTHASEKVGNKEIVAVSYDGVYSVLAYADGLLVGSFDTTDKDEAVEVYRYNADKLYA